MYEEWEDEQYETHLSQSGELYNKYVKVKHFRGVAFYVTAYITSGDNRGMVECYMVGDDRKHIVDPDDMTVLDEEDFCFSCGQIGCAWH